MALGTCYCRVIRGALFLMLSLPSDVTLYVVQRGQAWSVLGTPHGPRHMLLQGSRVVRFIVSEVTLYVAQRGQAEGVGRTKEPHMTLCVCFCRIIGWWVFLLGEVTLYVR